VSAHELGLRLQEDIRRELRERQEPGADENHERPRGCRPRLGHNQFTSSTCQNPPIRDVSTWTAQPQAADRSAAAAQALAGAAGWAESDPQSCWQRNPQNVLALSPDGRYLLLAGLQVLDLDSGTRTGLVDAARPGTCS
jgi:hypothetical protein